MNSPTGKLSDEHIALFFRKLKNDLNCSSTGMVVAQVRQILSKVKNFSIDQIANKIPPLLYMALSGHSRHANEKEIDHLDELAETLYREDKRSGRGWFKSEIEALGISIVILKRIQDLFDRMGVQAFPYILSDELKHAVREEAA